MRKKNPFRLSYLGIVALCFIMISSMFFAFNQINYNAEQKRFHEEKSELVMKEFERQLSLIEDISVRIASNYEFQPYYFEGKIEKELSMLKTFSQYKYASLLTEDYFLYYDYEYIYRSTNSTLDLNIYLKENLSNEVERECFLNELSYVKENMSDTWNGYKILPFSNKMYILVPFQARNQNGFSTAVLGFSIENDILESRFQFATGGYKGKLALYDDSELLFSNVKFSDIREEKEVFTVGSSNGIFKLYYLPEISNSAFFEHYGIQLILLMFDFILIILIVSVWAENSYKPLKNLLTKYQHELPENSIQLENSFDGLGYMMDSIIKNSAESEFNNHQKFKMLKNQLLCMLVQSNNILDSLPYLEEMNIIFPSSLFQVISFSFEKVSDINDDFLNMLMEELEKTTDKENSEYVYACCDYKRKLISVICNFELSERKDLLTDIIISVGESFDYLPSIGIGNHYTTVSAISASWLESLNAIHAHDQKNGMESSTFVYNTEYLQQIVNALKVGNEEIAMEKMKQYVIWLKEADLSLLMQQYIFAEFTGEVTRLSRDYQVELSTANISLMISAKNLSVFENAGNKVINEFCKKYKQIKDSQELLGLKEIYAYINEHFTDYEISLENIAGYFKVNTATVRQAVLKYTGKTYKDYIIFLRIEYAKKILKEKNSTIAEVCKMTGYGNISYFIRLFRETVGVTPANYRRTVIENELSSKEL